MPVPKKDRASRWAGMRAVALLAVAAVDLVRVRHPEELSGS